MAPGGRPPHSPLPQVPGVFPQAAAVCLVVVRDPHHQDRVVLHRHGLHQRGESAPGSASAALRGYFILFISHKKEKKLYYYYTNYLTLFKKVLILVAKYLF